MPLSCIVIDDDLDAIDEISAYILSTPGLELIRSFSDPVAALNYIRGNGDFDMLFMDVDMPNMNGIELSAMVRDRAARMVFSTCHAKYALDAFDVQADGFLLKPFNYAKFFSVVSRFFNTEGRAVQKSGEYLFVKNKSEDLKMVKVRYSDIIAIESLANYIRIYTTDLNIVTHLKLKEAREIFGKRAGFMQLHRSFLISGEHITSIDGNILTMSNGSKFTIGNNFRKTLDNFLTNRTLKPTHRNNRGGL
jgi:DNA-binding LytR/AlgR family response regulator